MVSATDQSDRRSDSRPGASATADLLFDAVNSAAIGGAAMALFFLAVDFAAGRPLFTPALIGATIFTDVDPAAVTEIDMQMVAYFTVVHFVAFGAFGAAVSYLCRWTGLSQRSPAVVTGAVFVLLSAVSLLGALVTLPGVVAVIGLQWVLAGNLVTAGAIAAFLRWSHRDDEPEAGSESA